MKTLFVINPISGKGKSGIRTRAIKQIQKKFERDGHTFRIILGYKHGQIEEIIQEAIDGKYDSLVAAGGDGTVNEIAQKLLGTQIAFGVIPMGSGNGFARHLGYSRRPKKAVNQIMKSQTVEVDTADFGGKAFLNTAGIGIDAEVAKRFSRDGKRGLKTYVKLASKLLFSFKAFDCKVEVDGKEYNYKKLLFLDIANGTQWGSGARIAPTSKMTDGYLEMVMVERTSFLEYPRMLAMLFDGTIHQHPKVKVIRGKKFSIERSTPGNAHVDGESIKLGKKIECEIKEKSMRLLVPGRKKSY